MIDRPPSSPHLLIVVPSFFPDVYGGVERQAQILAEAIGRVGWRVTLLAPTLQGPKVQSEATDYGEIVRLRVSALPARGGRYLKATIGWTVRSFAWIVRRRRQFAGVYQLHHRLHAAGPLLAAAFTGLPIWVKPGGAGEGSEFAALRAKRYVYGHLVAELVKAATTGFVAISQMVEDDLAREGIAPTRIVRVPNGVKAVGSAEFEAHMARRSGARFICAGRLVRDKYVDVLLRAVATLPAAARWSLSVVGDGPESDSLRALAVELGVQDRVDFAGVRDDVPEFMLDHDVFLSGSPREGLSNAMLEAMAAGLIPVCVKAGGVEELLADDRGFVVAEPEPAGIAAALSAILAMTPEARRARQAQVHAYASRALTIDSVAALTIALFSSGGTEA